MTSEVMDFMRRFLQHVPPPGFMKVRYYGFMNPNAAADLNEVRTLIELSYGFEIRTPEYETGPPAPLYCPLCGGVLKYRCSVLPHEMGPFRDTGQDGPFFKEPVFLNPNRFFNVSGTDRTGQDIRVRSAGKMINV
jgi:hypothetical protein